MLLDRKEGWVVINKQGDILFKPFIIDNGPDYFEEGLFRFEQSGKMGFADKNYQIIIPAEYDFVTPFENGLAIYYIGGEKVSETNKTQKQMLEENQKVGELHWYWGGNIKEKGYLNKSNQRFKWVGKLRNDRRKAINLNNENIYLNKQGIIKKQYGF